MGLRLFMVRGYKCFNSDMTNRNGCKFEIGCVYNIVGDVKFGVYGNGYHMCKNMVDVFRYFDCFNNDVIVCEVIGSGKIDVYDDEYNGYYDMYSVEYIEIVRIIDRIEIINVVLNMNEFNILRFVQLFKLNDIEIELFKDRFSKYNSILLAIDYYQNGNKDAYINYYNNQMVRRRVNIDK